MWLQQRLLEETELTLEKCFQIVRATQLSKKNPHQNNSIANVKQVHNKSVNLYTKDTTAKVVHGEVVAATCSLEILGGNTVEKVLGIYLCIQPLNARSHYIIPSNSSLNKLLVFLYDCRVFPRDATSYVVNDTGSFLWIRYWKREWRKQHEMVEDISQGTSSGPVF